MGCGPSKESPRHVKSSSSATDEVGEGKTGSSSRGNGSSTDGLKESSAPKKAGPDRTQASSDRTLNQAVAEALLEAKAEALLEAKIMAAAPPRLLSTKEPSPKKAPESSKSRLRFEGGSEDDALVATADEPGDSSVGGSEAPSAALKIKSPKKKYDPAKHEALLSNVVGTGAVVVGQVFLPLSMPEFRRLFWTGRTGVGGAGFYKDFVGVSLGDDEVECSAWEPGKEVVAGTALNSISRTITSKHPLALSFPVSPIAPLNACSRRSLNPSPLSPNPSPPTQHSPSTPTPRDRRECRTV